jgi:hypothetical protein
MLRERCIFCVVFWVMICIQSDSWVYNILEISYDEEGNRIMRVCRSLR